MLLPVLGLEAVPATGFAGAATDSDGAEDVAEAVYRAVVQDRFLVLTHDKTRWLWRFRRWAPERYFRHMVKAVERRRSKAR